MSDGEWFAPKRFGYGAGLPIAWQGWAVLLGYIALIALAGAALMPRHYGVWMAIVIALSLVLTVMAAQHTRSGWKWRWGRDG